MNYYVLQLVGDVEPVVHGPYDCEADRDSVALSLRAQDGGDLKDGLYPLDCKVSGHTGAKALAAVGTYSGGFFEEVDQ